MEVWFEEALQVPYAEVIKILDFLQSPVKQIFFVPFQLVRQ